MRFLSVIFFIFCLLPASLFHAMNTPSESLFTFKPLQATDLPELYQWFQDPDIQHWWPVPTQQEDFFKDFLKKIRSSCTQPYLIYMADQAIGYIQYYHIDRQDSKQAWLPLLPPTTVGIDQFIGKADCRGKGYGPVLLKAFIAYLKEHIPDLKTVIVDPDPTNSIAIRCYEKAGFVQVGTYQAPWDSALLMRYDL